MLTDAALGTPLDRQVRSHCLYADTYMYVFDYRSRNSTLPEWMGKRLYTAEHAGSEDIYKFQHWDTPNSFAGILLVEPKLCPVLPCSIKLSKQRNTF